MGKRVDRKYNPNFAVTKVLYDYRREFTKEELIKDTQEEMVKHCPDIAKQMDNFITDKLEKLVWTGVVVESNGSYQVVGVTKKKEKK